MGDRIAILKQQSKIAQYDTPENILTDPADDFVRDFVGTGASIKRLSLSKVREIETADWPIAKLTDSHEAVREKLQGSERDYLLLLDEQNRPRRWVNIGELERGGGSLEEAGRPVVAIVSCEASLFETLDAMVISHKGSAVVVNEEGAYLGVVDFAKVLEVLDAMRNPDREKAPT